MNKGDNPIQNRKQAEQSILKNMRAILSRVSLEKSKLKRTEKEAEKVDRSHIFSIIHRFTEMKRSTKIH